MSLEIGERLAAIGGQAALANVGEWETKANEWFAGLPFGTHFTSEDLIAAVGLPRMSSSNRNNAVGAKIRGWAATNKLETVGYTKAQRSRSHGRIIRVWSK